LRFNVQIQHDTKTPFFKSGKKDLPGRGTLIILMAQLLRKALFSIFKYPVVFQFFKEEALCTSPTDI
jgi:hypothetical protein